MANPDSTPETVRGNIGVSPQMRWLFDDFLDYQDAHDERMYTEMLLVEYSPIVEDINYYNIRKIFEPQRRLFPDYIKSKTGSRIFYVAPATTMETLNSKLHEFDGTLTWLVRGVILHGLATEMQEEKYIPAPIEELTV